MGCGSSKLVASPGSEVQLKSPRTSLIKGKSINGNGEMKQKNVAPRRDNSLQADLPGAVPESVTEDMPAPVTFEIPATDEDSIIKKHPPKRLQKLEEQQLNVTQERLLEKQQSAKDRRQKILQERVQSSRASTGRGTRRTVPRDPCIPEQIENEKTAGSHPNSRHDNENLEF